MVSEPESIGDVLGAIQEQAVVLTCPDCGKTRDGVKFGGPLQIGPRYSQCPVCEALEARRREAREEQQRQESLEQEWLSLCPSLYRKTDPVRLVAEHPLASKPLAEVMAWQYGPKGIYAIGPTDTGKTRSLFLLLRRLLEEGRVIRAFDCAAFGYECRRRFMDGTGEDWIDGLTRVEVVFFDDFGKMPLTERVEAELFAVIERRSATELPILATSNMTGADLVAKASGDRGAPLVRRLREFCKVVVFGRGD